MGAYSDKWSDSVKKQATYTAGQEKVDALKRASSTMGQYREQNAQLRLAALNARLRAMQPTQDFMSKVWGGGSGQAPNLEQSYGSSTLPKPSNLFDAQSQAGSIGSAAGMASGGTASGIGSAVGGISATAPSNIPVGQEYTNVVGGGAPSRYDQIQQAAQQQPMSNRYYH